MVGEAAPGRRRFAALNSMIGSRHTWPAISSPSRVTREETLKLRRAWGEWYAG
jgi:hypothetical protein